MNNSTLKFSLSLPSRYKLVLAVLIVAGAAVHLLNTGYRDWNSGADVAYVLALLVLFFSKETADDERVQELKLKALTVSFFAGWAVTGAVRFIVYLQTRPAPPRTMSSYDAMFAMLVVALGLFHFWRWQDGRGEKNGE